MGCALISLVVHPALPAVHLIDGAVSLPQGESGCCRNALDQYESQTASPSRFALKHEAPKKKGLSDFKGAVEDIKESVKDTFQVRQGSSQAGCCAASTGGGLDCLPLTSCWVLHSPGGSQKISSVSASAWCNILQVFKERGVIHQTQYQADVPSALHGAPKNAEVTFLSELRLDHAQADILACTTERREGKPALQALQLCNTLQSTSQRVAACYASLLQESKEALERLRRMGAYEAQDFDVTVSVAQAAHVDCSRGCAFAFRLDEPGFILLYMSLFRLEETARSCCSRLLKPADIAPHVFCLLDSTWICAGAPTGERLGAGGLPEQGPS